MICYFIRILCDYDDIIGITSIPDISSRITCNKIMRNRHLALICGIISITIMFFILWSIEMSSDPEGSLFLILFLTIAFVSVQIPFLLPIF